MLKGGLVGFGRMGITHFSILNSHPDVKFMAACDSSGPMMKLVNKHLGLATFDDSERMYRECELDFVIVSTPTPDHAPQVTTALTRGMHVFVEKPFALTPEDGAAVLGALSTVKVVNQVGYVLRFNEIMEFTKSLLDGGTLGEMIHFRIEVSSATVLKDVESGWRGEKKRGGGALFEMGSHAANLVSYLFGAPESVSGTVMRSIYSKGVEDSVATTLNYTSGLYGTLAVNWSDLTQRKPYYRVEILCRGGKVISDLHESKVYFQQKPSDPRFEQGWNKIYVTDLAKPVRFYLRGYEFTRQLDWFIDEIAGRSPTNRSTFADAYVTDTLLHKIAADGNSRV